LKIPTIISTDNKITNLLAELLDILLQHGASFDAQLQIHYDENGLSLHSVGIVNHLKKYLDIPTSLMLSIENYSFSIEDEKLLCKSRDEKDAIREKLMYLMVDIYNQTDKIPFQKVSSLFYNLKENREFLNLLLVPKENNKKTEAYLKNIDEEDYDKLLIDTFLGTRTFHLKNTKGHLSILMPMIDYFNHSSYAKGYQRVTTTDRDTLYVESTPKENSSELYVKYNNYDSLDTFLYYGFVDTTSPFLFSTAVTIALEDGREIEITTANVSIKKELPKALAPLRAVLPAVIGKDKNSVKVSRVAIPNKLYPASLRKSIRVILSVINKDKTLTEAEIKKQVLFIEKEIIKKNLQYYVTLQENLQPILEDNSVSDYIKEQLELLIKHNIKHIKNYGKWFTMRNS